MVQLDIGTVIGLLIVGILFCGLPGVAIGYLLGSSGQINNILNLLKQFKLEGHNDKWLK